MRELCESKERIVRVIEMMTGLQERVESLKNENHKLRLSLENQHYLETLAAKARQCNAVFLEVNEDQADLNISDEENQTYYEGC